MQRGCSLSLAYNIAALGWKAKLYASAPMAAQIR